MKLGIVGLPNVGNPTLSNAITSAGVPAHNYAFCTIDPNVVSIFPDLRREMIRKRDFIAPMLSPSSCAT